MHTATRSLLGLLLAFGPLTSCDKDSDVTPTYEKVVFGHFYGECGGESCIEIFQLDARQQTLAEDQKDLYPSSDSPYDGEYTISSASAYAKVSDLPSLIPAQLLEESKHVIGQPDVADQGGYYVEINIQGTRRFWLIDTQKENIPEYLHPLVDALQDRIAKLQ